MDAIVTDVIMKVILPDYSPVTNQSKKLPNQFPQNFSPAICGSVFPKCR